MSNNIAFTSEVSMARAGKTIFIHIISVIFLLLINYLVNNLNQL
jgi:hypothetical protein